MKKIKLSLFMACLVLQQGNVFAQWSGTNPLFTTSSVGIGSGTPAAGYSLHVDGDIKFTQSAFNPNSVHFESPNGENGMSLIQNNGERADLRFNGSTLKLVARDGSYGGPPLPESGISINTQGKVGLGNNNPFYRLNVNDNSRADYGSWISANSQGPALWVRRDWMGTYTGSGSYTSGERYALMVENFDFDNYNGGGMFQAENDGVTAYAEARKDGSFATGVTGIGHAYYPDLTLSTATGVYGQADNGRYSYGVQGYATASDQAFGVTGIASINAANCSNASTRAYGLYGAASCSGFDYAGYFAGNTLCGSTFFSSDEKLKQNIKPLDNTMELIRRLNPKSYEFKQSDEFKGFNFDKGRKYGLIAQELEKVLPELVRNAHNPEIKDKNGNLISKSFDFKAVDYVSLIPVLISGIKEQDERINEQQQQITALLATVNDLKQSMAECCVQSTHTNNLNTDKASLEQNIPNPLDNSTLIRYYLPQSATNATIQVVNPEGKIMLTQRLAQTGNGQFTIETASWAPGTYSYQLSVNGNSVDAKKMVVVH